MHSKYDSYVCGYRIGCLLRVDSAVLGSGFIDCVSAACDLSDDWGELPYARYYAVATSSALSICCVLQRRIDLP